MFDHLSDSHIYSRLEYVEKLYKDLGLENFNPTLRQDDTSIIDITHFLNIAVDELRAKSKLIDSVAHDIKNYIFVGKNFYKKSGDSERFDPKRRTEFSKKSLRAVNMALDCFECAYLLESYKTNIPKDNFNINMIISDLLDETKTKYANKGISFSVLQEENLEVLSNIKLLSKNILKPIIDNAFKFTPLNKSFEIKLITEGDNKKVIITNESPSIELEKIEQIEDLYTLYSYKGSNGENGTGIQLSTAMELASRLGHSISISSIEDKFELILIL